MKIAAFLISGAHLVSEGSRVQISFVALLLTYIPWADKSF